MVGFKEMQNTNGLKHGKAEKTSMENGTQAKEWEKMCIDFRREKGVAGVQCFKLSGTGVKVFGFGNNGPWGWLGLTKLVQVGVEAVHIALQAPLKDRFRELPEADTKEILHQRMFKSGSYKSLSEHVALYEALEGSIERAQGDEFLAEKDKSHKRRRDDQYYPPP
uniref:Uncharacterized protein n=1 Tax=Tanacetum cinerariifolium TaxID=118510 RepID=A0A6L2PAV4_TANCI|nr:hypothetical protein [Tanacetum cinerariifolium]